MSNLERSRRVIGDHTLAGDGWQTGTEADTTTSADIAGREVVTQALVVQLTKVFNLPANWRLGRTDHRDNGGDRNEA